jgi:hypothetical protein
MSLAVWFWLIWFLSAIFFAWSEVSPAAGPYPFYYRVRNTLWFLMFTVLGWQTFGSPMK